MSIHAVIVTPTYNEAKNLDRHIKSIFNEVDKQSRVKFNVLIVDDNSPDGTQYLAKNYRWKDSRVHLHLRKKKEGLGKAYIDGMLTAIEKFNPDIIFEMDADGQHNPRDILRMVAEIERGADFIIGSRYVQGGSIAGKWSVQQRLKSKAANLATTHLLGIDGVKDCSGGFRAIKAGLLKQIQLDKLHVKGYAFQAVLLEAAQHEGALIKEIPIHFSDREEGESKMSLKDMLEPWGVFARIRVRRLWA